MRVLSIIAQQFLSPKFNEEFIPISDREFTISAFMLSIALILFGLVIHIFGK